MCVRFASIHMVHPYSSIDAVTAWKKLYFIFMDISNFHLIDNLPITVCIFTKHILISLSVDEILLPRYANLSTNFKGLPLRVEMAHSRLKYVHSCGGCVILGYTVRIWLGVFARSARSF